MIKNFWKWVCGLFKKTEEQVKKGLLKKNPRKQLLQDIVNHLDWWGEMFKLQGRKKMSTVQYKRWRYKKQISKLSRRRNRV
jgi:hypothetical protein